jgi:Flp pilus assembly protein TadD
MRRAVALDPRSAQRHLGLARSYFMTKQYAQADSAYDRAIALAPDQYHAYFEKGRTLIVWRGDVEGARRTMAEAEARIGKVEFVRKMCVACFDWAGPLAADYERVLDQLSLQGFGPNDSANYYTARAYRAHARKDAARSRVYWDSARVVTERIARAEPDDGYAHENLSTIYAGLGRADASSREITAAADLYRAQGDTVNLLAYRRLVTTTNLVLLGQRNAAADTLALILADSTYPFASLAALRVDPFYGELRGVPAFDRLIAGP